MKEKPSERDPSPRAIAYECGRTIHLLPLERALTNPAYQRLKAAVASLAPASLDHLPVEALDKESILLYLYDAAGALFAFAAWDEGGLDWGLDDLDPDEVLTLRGDALAIAADRCRVAIMAPSVTRFGLFAGDVITAGWRCIGGRPGLRDPNPEEIPAPGEGEPAES